MSRNSVSLKDISKACGVSIATVSKALNDHSDIGQDTKENIRRVAEELGYHPNAAAQALKTKRTNNIGVLFVDEANSGLTHDYFSHVLDSFKRCAEQNGFDITFINADKTRPDNMSYLTHAMYRGFDGVVIACVDFFDPQVDELINSTIPVVTIDHIFYNRIAIISDNARGMRDLVSYVYRMGHRKIAYIHGLESSVTRARLASYYRTLQDFGITVPDEYVLAVPYRDSEAAYRATLKLLSLPEPPTCILYPDDFSAFGGINALSEKGLRIPDDISIAGYDGTEIASRVIPKLTTIAQDTEGIGKAAAERLIDMINNPKAALIEQVVIEGKLEPGGTVGKPA